VLPKNPWLADHLLARALARRYPDFGPLAPLPDRAEMQAQSAALRLARHQAGGWRAAAAAISRIALQRAPAGAQVQQSNASTRPPSVNVVDVSLPDQKRDRPESAASTAQR
jgi:hypothetical protein